MVTMMRTQKLAASTGMLAAERERLEREIEALSNGLPGEAAAIVARADELMAEHGAKIAELKSKRDAIDATFEVDAAKAKEARAKARGERLQAHCNELVAVEASRLDHIANAQELLEKAVAEINAAFDDHSRLREIARALTPGVSMPALMALSPTDLANRTGAWVMGLLKGVRLPGALPGAAHHIGPLALLTSIHFRQDMTWREREERVVAPAIEAAVGYAQGDA
jgi:uncharacterized protein (DUF3084 family)